MHGNGSIPSSYTLLSLILAAAAYAPAHAATCEANDGDPTTHEVSGGSTSTSGGFACGSNGAFRPNNAGSSSLAFGMSNQADALPGGPQLTMDLGGGSSIIWFSGAASAFGIRNDATAKGASAFGFFNKASGMGSSAFGFSAQSLGKGSVAFGGWNDRNGDNEVTLDLDLDSDGVMDASSETSIASGASAVAVGAGVRASGDYSSAVGVDTLATGARSSAIGYQSQALADDSIAIGSGAIADRAGTVSVGSAGNERQITNVAAGTQATDAVNLSQLQSVLATANAYTDTAVATGGTAANAYTDNREAAIRDDMATADAQTLASANSYADAGDAATLQSANSYTDTTATQTLNTAKNYTDNAIASFRTDIDDRFDHLDRRIDKMAAMSGAYAGMAMNTAGLAGRNRVGVGVGGQGSEKAMAVGYQRAIGDRASVSIGAAFGGGEKSLMGGAGFSW